MGTVFLAEDPMIGRRVALKVIRMDDSGSAEQQRMIAQSFLKETRLAGVLHHPGVVGVFDAGKQDNLAYIVMEFIDGPTLAGLLLEQPRPDMAKLLDICGQAAAVLDYAHAHGVIHRDVKPTNILVQQDGAVKICDFGIAKVAQSTEFTMTQAGMALGTPEFMSPEQVLGQPLDGRSDQWSLAVVAYEVATGSRPFHAESYTQVMAQIMTLDHEPASNRNAALPKGVDAVFTRALAKKPAERFPNCRDFMEALQQAFAPASFPAPVSLSAAAATPPPVPVFAPSTPTSASQPVLFQPSTPSAAVMAAADSSTMPGGQPVRKTGSRKLMAAAAIGVVIVGGAVAWRVLSRSAPARVEALPAPVLPETPKKAPTGRKPLARTTAPSALPAAVASAVTADAPPGMYPVRLTTVPEGVGLTIDKQPTCPSPCAVELAAGRHAIVARKEGYFPLAKDFTVDANQPEITFTLSQITGSLMIATEPAGASIAVNGTPRTETTPANIPLPIGQYKVKLTKEGFEPLEHEVTVSGEGIFRLTVSLAKSSH